MRRWTTVAEVVATALVLLVATAAPVSAASRVFLTDNSQGGLYEYDLVSRTYTSVAPLVNQRGIAFGPAGPGGQALYAVVDDPGTANDRIVRYDATLAASTWLTLGSATPDPVDLTFDAYGNVYVINATQVVKYSPAGVELLRFSHGVIAGTGSGNAGKAWDVAVNPLNGEIVVAGRRVARFSATGTFLGDVYGNAGYGYAGLAFTTDGYAGVGGTAFLYVGNIASGADPVLVLDSNYQQIRQFSLFTTGNVIDATIDPATGDIFYAASVAPSDQFAWNETHLQTFSSTGIVSSGSARSIAVGTFSASLVVPEPAGAALLLASVCGLAVVLVRRRRVGAGG